MMGNLSFSRVGSTLIVDFGNKDILEMGEADDIGRQLTQKLEGADFKNILIDFQVVKLVTSSFIGVLLTLDERCSSQGIVLRLCGMSAELTQLFKQLKLDKTLHFYSTRQEGLRACGELGGSDDESDDGIAVR